MLRVKFSPLAAVATAAVLAVGVPAIGNAASYSNGTNTTTFDVTLKIIANCVIAALPLDFGQTQGVLATAVNVNTTLNVTCTNTTLYNVGLNAGTGAGSVGTTRYLSGTGGNAATVQFNLFQTAGATVWGNTQGTDTLGGTGNGTAQPITVYGNVPPQATPMPDTYKSTITATVYF
ncbi:Spore Coat Protein U domain protein [compost metagenome]|uniref:Csu type fimbrial protein n=1 Tax=Janthinobacterium sp. RT4P48 TaxID=3424188 RepID=UPI000F9B075B